MEGRVSEWRHPVHTGSERIHASPEQGLRGVQGSSCQNRQYQVQSTPYVLGTTGSARRLRPALRAYLAGVKQPFPFLCSFSSRYGEIGRVQTREFLVPYKRFTGKRKTISSAVYLSWISLRMGTAKRRIWQGPTGRLGWRCPCSSRSLTPELRTRFLWNYATRWRTDAHVLCALTTSVCPASQKHETRVNPNACQSCRGRFLVYIVVSLFCPIFNQNSPDSQCNPRHTKP